MLLARLHLAGISGFESLTITFDDDKGAPKLLNVIFGGEGVGKTALLSAIAATRPGHAVAQGPAPSPDSAPPFVASDIILGEDDPARPHPLRVMGPNAKLPLEREDAALLRRREQALFDRRASEGGFVLVAFSGARWFSRTSMMLSTPDRTLLRHDARASVSFDDPSRADLTRETKQVLSFAAISAALGGERGRLLDQALREALSALLEGSGAAYKGPHPLKLEPLFSFDGRDVDLDDLPRSLRHRIAFGALTLRALAAGYPDRDPRACEGVALIDDLEIEQDTRVQPLLPGLLRRALPKVQWIVTTSSPGVVMGAAANEVIALRRAPGSRAVEVQEGDLAILH